MDVYKDKEDAVATKLDSILHQYKAIYIPQTSDPDIECSINMISINELRYVYY